MKLLLDQNISRKLVKKLTPDFPGTNHVSHAGIETRPDFGVWKYAKDNEFTIITQDADYYELSLINGFPPKIIWLRCGNNTTNYIYYLIMEHKESIQQFIEEKEKFACLELF